MAQLLHHEVSATVSGVFLDANTGQQVSTTLDLFAEEENPTGDWYYVPGEEYAASGTFSDSQYSRVAGLTLCDPQGAVIAEAAADPAVPRLTAAARIVIVEAEIKPGVKVRWEHDFRCNHRVVFVFTRVPAQPGTILVVVVDGSQPGGRVQDASVNVQVHNKPGEGPGQIVTDVNGLVTFNDVPSGWYTISVASGQTWCALRRGPWKLQPQGTLNEGVALWPHWPIRGKVRFRNAQGQVVPGDPWSVTVRTYQGQELKETLQLGEADPDGSYPYESTDHIVSGAYTVKATFTPAEGDPQEQSGEAVVPNDCLRDHPNLDGATTAVNSAGAHAVVQGPAFTFQ
jgi:hypothetical protein